MKIRVIGLGIYSLAISKMLAKNKNEIMIWTESKEKADEYKKTKQIKSIYDTDLPKNIKISADLEKVLKDTDIIYIITASKYVHSVVKNIEPLYKRGTPICIASKGIEETRQETLSKVIFETLCTPHIAVISGPTFAVDILNDEPVALALASKSAKARNTVIQTLANDKLKLRPNKDLIGVELCGSIKNVIAIAAGILKGLGYSESTHAFLINESLHDIKDIIYYLGGKPKTILSFAGIGDLMLTCTSPKSRNFSFGYLIGSTKDPTKIKEYLTHNTVEGYYTLDTLYQMLRAKGIEIELITTIYNIVYNNEDPNILPKFLIEK